MIEKEWQQLRVVASRDHGDGYWSLSRRPHLINYELEDELNQVII